jgi:MoxR-like ATPase
MIRVEQNIAEYAVLLARATRSHEALAIGLSPRASTLLVAAARAAAACEGRDFVVPDDLKSLFMPLARHRVTLAPAAEMEGVELGSVLGEILGQVPAPR